MASDQSMTHAVNEASKAAILVIRKEKGPSKSKRMQAVPRTN